MLTKDQFMHLIERHRHAATGNELFYYRDLIRIELERIYEAPREWVEAEPSMRGAPLREVLNGKHRGTAIFHSEKPFTSNPVWEIIGQTD